MEEHKELTRKWAISFLESKGGYRRVAEKTGLGTQQLYYIVTEKRHLTWDVLVSLHQQWPDEVNLNALASGRIEDASKPDLDPMGNDGDNSGEKKFQASEVERIVREATEAAEKKALAYQSKYETLAEKVLAKAGFNWVTENTTGDFLSTPHIIDQPRLYFRNQKYSEKEVARMMSDVTVPGRA